jgi:hypothetical protein
MKIKEYTEYTKQKLDEAGIEFMCFITNEEYLAFVLVSLGVFTLGLILGIATLVKHPKPPPPPPLGKVGLGFYCGTNPVQYTKYDKNKAKDDRKAISESIIT